MAVSKRLRFEILRRDNHACRYCGRSAPEVKLTVDHVVPVSLGGQDVAENLVACCSDCNAGKSSASPDAHVVADVAEDAIRWRRAMEIANRMAVEEYEAKAAFREAFLDRWNDFSYTMPSYRSGTGREEERQVDLPADWEGSLASLYAAGLQVVDMHEAISIAMGPRIKEEFRYFVGVARNKIALRQSVAQELLRRGDA